MHPGPCWPPRADPRPHRRLRHPPGPGRQLRLESGLEARDGGDPVPGLGHRDPELGSALPAPVVAERKRRRRRGVQTTGRLRRSLKRRKKRRRT